MFVISFLPRSKHLLIPWLQSKYHYFHCFPIYLWLHWLQHARLPCPSPIPRAYSNSCALSWWCHPAISSSVVPFSSCLQSFPASVSFPISEIFTSVQFSRSVVSDSLQPHGLQHTRLPCPSATPGAYTNSTPSSQWCHQTISSSVIPFSSLQFFPASGSFPMSQFFASGGQSIGTSASLSVLPMNIQDWFSLWWTGWISLQSKGLSRVFSNTIVQKLIRITTTQFVLHIILSL